MNFTSKFNIGEMVQFTNDREIQAKVIEIKIIKGNIVTYNIQLQDANHTFLIDIHESRLEKVEDPPFIFAGHKVTQGNDKSKVQIGCKTVTRHEIENLLDLADKFEIFDFSTELYDRDKIRINQVEELYDKFFRFQKRSKFEQFLIDNSIYEIFIHNMNVYGPLKTISELESKHHISGLIVNAFSWRKAPEKKKFWENWDAKWVQYINQK